ncbi:MAG: hypothetical protein ISS57_00955 [Anaerolineales bacterium]|nr:hypothetical protein [Anaerolineales bacterium]
MAEKKETPKRPFEKCIPEDTRQHIKATRTEMRKSVESLFPPEFIAHRHAARREMLMAARSMIDHALERIEEH